MSPADADALWQSVSEFRWAHVGGTLVKFALAPSQMATFAAMLRAHHGARGWVSAGGNLGYLSVPADVRLGESTLPGLTLRGEAELWVGPRRRFPVMQRVKAALDPNNRFPTIDE